MNIEELKAKRRANCKVGLNMLHIFTKEETDFFFESLIEENKRGKSITKLCKEYGIGRSKIALQLSRRGHTSFNYQNQLSVRKDLFEFVETEEDAYWLGFIYADGCIMDDGSFHISLKSTDFIHLEKFAKYIQWLYQVRIYDARCAGKIHRKCSISFATQQLKSNFNKLGVVPRKSLILTFPTFEQVPEHLIRHFIRGYFDGDGYIRNPLDSNANISVLGTVDFLEGFLNTCGINQKIVKDKRNENVSFFDVSGNTARDFLDYIYKDCTIYLDRKYYKYILHKPRFEKRLKLKNKLPTTESLNKLTLQELEALNFLLEERKTRDKK